MLIVMSYVGLQVSYPCWSRWHLGHLWSLGKDWMHAILMLQWFILLNKNTVYRYVYMTWQVIRRMFQYVACDWKKSFVTLSSAGPCSSLSRMCLGIPLSPVTPRPLFPYCLYQAVTGDPGSHESETSEWFTVTFYEDDILLSFWCLLIFFSCIRLSYPFQLSVPHKTSFDFANTTVRLSWNVQLRFLDHSLLCKTQ